MLPVQHEQAPNDQASLCAAPGEPPRPAAALAIANGGEMEPLVAALQAYERQRTEVTVRLEAAKAPRQVIDPVAVRRKLESYLD